RNWIMRTYSLKKEIFSLLCVTAAVSMAGATLSCAPQGLISLGNDGGAQSTGGASTGGSKSSESGGAAGKETDACAGKACGDSCSVCDEGPCPAIDLTCDGNGECGGLAACNAEESCEQGDTKKVDCNTCECTDGRWVCTDMACGVPKCEDGDV